MIGLMTEIFALVKLTKVKNGRGGWTLQRDSKGEIWGCVLPAQIQEVMETRQGETQQYDLKIMIWKSDASLIDTETLIQFEGNTYKIFIIDNRNRLSDKVIVFLRGEEGNEPPIYT